MAYWGFGVWSLAVHSVIGSIATVLFLWNLSNWRPDFTFSWGAVKDLLGFSTNLLGTQILNYWVRNIDNLLIGRFLGTSALGLYSRAYSIMLYPLVNVSRVISRVMFPALSIIRDEKDRVKNLYLRMTRVIAMITFPLMAGLFVTAEPLVLTLLGDRWTDIIPLLKIFTVLGALQSIGTLNGNLYLSQGRADLQFRVSLFLKANVIFAIVIGLRWGIIGVATCYAMASVINSYPAFYFAGRLVNITYFERWKHLFSALSCSAAMAVIVWTVGTLLPTYWPHWLYLTVQVPFGIIIYFCLIHFFKVRAYIEARNLVKEQWQKRFNRKKLTPIV